ncbi:hypothetical protein BKA93DRAFT_357189 [Sparassis latifolia]|uniref:Uncharacterized protein n=1 Tax=Sparassis crispa TaxID=139825 RepID=A0A401GMJ8_9APHY|nr:predicted protein [Sparassis crispa]GBE83436.1 predicted protein [Sparassis crispa]
MSTVADDPRDSSAVSPLTFPDTWETDAPDGFSATVMFVCGLIMVTRNRYIAWPALMMALNTYFNRHPLRAKEGSSSPLGALGMAGGALVSSYLPMFLIVPQRSPPA